MIRGLALVLTLGLVCAAPGLAFAQDDEEESEFGRPGWYAGAYGLFAVSAYRDQGGDFDNSGGLSVRGGYRVSPSFAIEGEVEWINEFSANLNNGSRTTAWTINGSVNTKFFLSDGRVQPYGLLGAGGMSVNRDNSLTGEIGETDWGFRFGAGLDLYATEHIAIGLEARYNWGVGKVWELDYASFGVGMLYRF